MQSETISALRQWRMARNLFLFLALRAKFNAGITETCQIKSIIKKTDFNTHIFKKRKMIQYHASQNHVVCKILYHTW